MRTPNRVLDVGAWMLENGHRALLKLSGGRFPKKVLGMEPVELHTIGRRSGERRSTLLTAPICEPDRIVLVASKGGHEHHPAWYLNLVANPEVEITVGDETRRMRARTAEGDERAELWPVVVRAYRGYEGYQRNTEREIPVIVCEPA
jgi:deazaflavin-dependent oxidoreductase (nitroreductase family)